MQDAKQDKTSLPLNSETFFQKAKKSGSPASSPRTESPRVIHKIQEALPPASRPVKQANRTNVGLELIGSLPTQPYGLDSVAIKTMQFLVSGHTICFQDSTWAERLLHTAQALLALGLIGLNIYIFIKDENCLNKSLSAICQAAKIMDALYKGIMLTGWGAGELARKKTPDTAPDELEDVDVETDTEEEKDKAKVTV